MSSLTKIDVLVPRPKETRTKLDSTRIPVRRWTGGFYSCWLSDSTNLYVFLSLAVFFALSRRWAYLKIGPIWGATGTKRKKSGQNDPSLLWQNG